VQARWVMGVLYRYGSHQQRRGPGRAWTRPGSLTDCTPGQHVKSPLMDRDGRSESCYGSEGWGFESLRARHWSRR